MNAQKEQARAAWKGSGAEAANEKIWFDILDAHGPTDFMGYETEKAEACVLSLIDANGESVKVLKKGAKGFVVTNQTPFYGESGGQAGDTGTMKSNDGRVKVTDTQKKLGKIYVHSVEVTDGTLNLDAQVEMHIDDARRDAIRANHSATHLLHAALRRHLGEHVAQKGSLVAAERMRFDFSHSKSLSKEELSEIENEVNDRIMKNTSATTRLLPIEQAKEEGAIAMFGEKYEDEVRVLTMGGQDPDRPERAYSMELCGGTHVQRTGDIGLFKIINESAVSSGVRRIEALTGHAALKYVHKQEARVQQAAEQLKVSATQLPEKIDSLLSERKKLEQEISNLRQKLATGAAANEDETKDINGIKFVGKVMEGIPAKELKAMTDALKQKIGSGVVTLIAVDSGKASVVVGVTSDLTDDISAVDLVRVASAALGGKGGGGRPDMAQAGGPNPDAANDAISAVEDAI